MNALTDAEMMAAFGALSADRKELIFTCLSMGPGFGRGPAVPG
jgi:hypothetical protein